LERFSERLALSASGDALIDTARAWAHANGLKADYRFQA
jgi:hypothetical protein